MSAIDQYLDSQAARFEEELCEFLRIPSISADPGHRSDMHRAAEWVADQFRHMRLAAEVIPTAGHPLVYAESPAVSGAPTALVYGHYDVQPPDPLEKWITPFEPSRATATSMPARHGQQRPDVHPFEERRGLDYRGGSAAAELEVHHRGRGGSRQPGLEQYSSRTPTGWRATAS